jgi:hypothetical protein
MKGAKKSFFLQKNHIVVTANSGIPIQISVGPNKQNMTPLVQDINIIQTLKDELIIKSLQSLHLIHCTMIS